MLGLYRASTTLPLRKMEAKNMNMNVNFENSKTMAGEGAVLLYSVLFLTPAGY
jgi:hypothetical protein